MANFRAITAVCESVVYMLRSNYDPNDFNNELEFLVYSASDFAAPMEAGISLFLYRILPDGTHRIPTGRINTNGQRYQTRLPVNLYFLLTTWGKTASLQHTIAGWMLRTLEDHPILPIGLLNTVLPDVFHPDETVEISLTDLSNEDLLRVWEMLPQSTYRLSVPYVARSIRLESTQPLSQGQPIQERTTHYHNANTASP
ncbi:MAG: DUF4255 domain-containing protein [Ardenticatenaceae bacterium]|nr:DUF4255 domain-containing protein [Ardenticatenaceae bacterium]